MEIVKESSALDGKVESFLSTLLEGYEQNGLLRLMSLKFSLNWKEKTKKKSK